MDLKGQYYNPGHRLTAQRSYLFSGRYERSLSRLKAEAVAPFAWIGGHQEPTMVLS
jgi:hypothetical protein